MSKTLYWMQGGSCGGDTWSFMNAGTPDPISLMQTLDLALLWHPAVSDQSDNDRMALDAAIIAGEQPLDIFCLEGSVIHGPANTGRFDMLDGRPKRERIAALAARASVVVAVGTCASFGGIGAGSPTEAVGLQFERWEPGGLLGADFRSGSGLPVINLPGCPCHTEVIVGILSALVMDGPPVLTERNLPEDWYGVMVHQGCTRNEYHEYRVEEKRFGEKGCLFFHMGCHGPLVVGPCNKILWNQRSSKTRVGVPCFGCTRPDFPQPYPFFETRNIEGIPIELPDGVSRAHYMAYKGMAAAAAPKRLLKRVTRI